MAIDAVVAADGSGDYTTVTTAVAATPPKSTKRHAIHVKTGLYEEILNISVDTWNLTLVGDGMKVTIISGNQNFHDGIHTSKTATISVFGKGFIARDLTIQNTAGAAKQQAVALMSLSDHSAVYRCAIKGYQDTLYARSGKQFYRECHISGTVDFIFGNAAAVFQKCTILARLPLPKQKNTITAQGRKKADDATGFSFQFCTVAADDDLSHGAGATVETYLGRPWEAYSRVVFMKCSISDVVHPKGWLPWEDKPNSTLDPLYYGEYSNNGLGANVGGRVNWGGFHVIRDASEAGKFTVESFIQGNEWLPGTGVDYTPGL